MANDAIRPRKGDIYIVLCNGDATIRLRLERAWVTPKHVRFVNVMMKGIARFIELPRRAGVAAEGHTDG